MSKTTDNLQAAFAGESQANRKYLAFAKKADQEGYPQIAKLFRTAAAAETVHAHNHFNALGGVKSTTENLKAAIEGENYEVVSMYPSMIADAEAEGEKKANNSLRWAFEVEKVHEALYRYALEHMDPTLRSWISTFAQFVDIPIRASSKAKARSAIRLPKSLSKSSNFHL